MNRVTTREAGGEGSMPRLGLFVAPGDRAEITNPYRSRTRPAPATAMDTPRATGLDLPAGHYVWGRCTEEQRAALIRSGCWTHTEPIGPGLYRFIQLTGPRGSGDPN